MNIFRTLGAGLVLAFGLATGALAACPAGNTGPCEPWSTGNNAATDIVTLTDSAKFGLSAGNATWRTTTGVEILTYLAAKSWTFNTGTVNFTGTTQLNGAAFTTAATTALGTSGATIPLLSTANTWTLAQTFTATPVLTSGGITSSAASFSTNQAADGPMFGNCAISTCGANSTALTSYAYSYADTAATNANVGFTAFGSPAAINLNLNAKGAGKIVLGSALSSANGIVLSGISPGTIVSGGYLGLDSGNNVVTASGGGGGGSLTLTDGTHSVASTTQITVTGGTVGGTTPNATLAITGASGVTSVATTSPITGGTITGTGTIACATCVTASSPGAGVAHFAGSTQAVTSSAVVPGDFGTQTAAAVLAGPTSGSAATPSFRALASTDLPGVLDTTQSASYTVNASEQDIGNALTLTAMTGTPALTLPTASSTVFAPGQTQTITAPWVSGVVPWTITNSTGLAMRGLNGYSGTSATLCTGTQGTFVANADAATIDFFAGMQCPSTTALGGLFALSGATSHEVVQYVGTDGAQHLIQLGFGDLTGSVAAGQMPALTGDVTSSAGSTATALAASGVSAATYGDSTHVPQCAFDAKGRATSCSNVAISGGGSSAPAAPQGRLTLSTGKPVMIADVTAATTLYYDSYQGNQVPVWNGSSMTGLTIGSDEISMGLSATNHPASGFFDVFAVNSSSTLALCTVAWTNGTTRASAVSLKNGVYTITSAPTHCYGGAAGATDLAGSIGGANQATLLGCVATTSTNGQTAMQFVPAGASNGSNTWRGISNVYNRVRAGSTERDSTTSWTIAGSTGVWGEMHASNLNRVSWFDCLGQSSIDTTVQANHVPGSSGYDEFGVCLNSTSCTPNISQGAGGLAYTGATTATTAVVDHFSPVLGFNYAQAMEEFFTPAGVTSGAGQSQLVVILDY